MNGSGSINISSSLSTYTLLLSDICPPTAASAPPARKLLLLLLPLAVSVKKGRYSMRRKAREALAAAG